MKNETNKIDPLVLHMKQARKARKISQLEIARMLEVTSNAVTYWETGKNKPTRRNRARINLWLEGKAFITKVPRSMMFANKMRLIRLKRRMTLSEFSRSLGVGVSTAYNWESGVSRPSELNMMSIKEWEMDNPVLEE